MHVQIIHALMEEHVGYVQSVVQVTNAHVYLNILDLLAKLVN